MRTLLIILIAIVIIGGGWYWYSTMQTPAPTSTDVDMQMNDTMPDTDMQQTAQPGGTDAGMEDGTLPDTATEGSVKEFTVHGKPYSFTPATMTVKKGDTVKITFVNDQGMHDWNVDEFNAHTNVIQAGQQETVTFVADKTGSFEYYCSVGNHRAMGMKGTLTVTN